MKLINMEDDGKWVLEDREFFNIRGREGWGGWERSGFYNDTSCGNGRGLDRYSGSGTNNLADGNIDHYNYVTGSQVNESLCGIGKPKGTYTGGNNDITV